MTPDMLIWFIFGLSLGAVVPTALAIKTVLKSLLIEIRGYKDIERRLRKSEKEVLKMIEEQKKYTRDDLPYDAMGDYSGLDIPPGPMHTGMESPDEWYRAEFGGCDED